MSITVVGLSCITAVVILLQYVGGILPNYVALLLLVSIYGVGVFMLHPDPRNRLDWHLGGERDSSYRLLWVSLVVFCGLRIAIDAFEYKDEVTYAISSFVKDVSVLFLAILITNKLSYRVAPSLAAFGIGIALYAAVNVIAYKLGVSAQQSMMQPHAGLSVRMTERMLAPFGPGLNSFGSFVACGALCCFFGAAASWRVGMRMLSAISVVCFSICVFALIQVEMRMSLLVVAFATGWLLLPAGNFRRVVISAVAISSVFVPIAFTTGFAASVFDDWAPDFAISYAQRNERDFASAGGRTPIWEQGIDLVLSGQVALFGEGALGRDPGAVVDEAMRSQFGGASFSYHNGPLDALIVYGAIVGGLMIMLLLMASYAISSLSRFGNPAACDVNACGGVLGGVLILNWLEAFSGAAVFWCVILLVYRLRFPAASRLIGRF